MLTRLWKTWLFVAKKIGHLQSWALLALVYFVVMAPFALALRLFSDPLCLRGSRCWHSLPANDASRLHAASQQF
jgi:hypothetical protein